MFESFRGTEYGWETGRTWIEDITGAYLFALIVWILREDSDPYWTAETKAYLSSVYSGYLGTSSDHVNLAMINWRKYLALYRGIMGKLFPLGSSGTPLLDRRKPSDLASASLWRPRREYNTDLVKILEHEHTQEVIEELLQILRDEGVTNRKTASEETQLVITEKLNSAKIKALYLVLQFGWLPRSQEPEQLEAHTFSDACERYQATRAGKKAKRLLLEHLTPDQERDYWRKGYFFVMPRDQDVPLHERRLYVIERSYPNGNVMSVRQRWARNGTWHWYPQKTYCFHTEEPHALDDIILGQKLLLENREDEFLKGAHETEPQLKTPLHIAKRSV